MSVEKLPAGIGFLQLRRARMADADWLLEWRNDSDARAASFSEEVVERYRHIEWLRKKLADPNCAIYIAEANGVPVGQVRIDAGTVSYSVAREHRCRGYGTQIIYSVMGQSLQALVKRSNVVSCRIFEKLGWSVLSEDSGQIVFVTHGIPDEKVARTVA